MWGISRKYGVTINQLVSWNNIKNPNLIYSGNSLKIYINGNNTNKITYTIKRGDTLWGIAKRYRTTISRLAQINGIKNPNLIYAGRTIYIY